MAKKITDLPALTVADDTDLFAIVDVSGNVTKKVTRAGLVPDASVTMGKLNGGSTAGTLVSSAAGVVSVKSMRIGIITGSTVGTTGNKPVTGIGYKPSLVKFIVLPTSSTTIYATGEGAIQADGSQYAVTGATSTAGSSRVSWTNRCIAWVTPGSATPNLLCAYVSMDTDGFTINVITAASNFDVAYEAYP